MTKKTARTTKPSQQRTKEEQWRRRMAAQARTGAAVTSAGSAVADIEDEMLSDTGTMSEGATTVGPTPKARAAVPTATAGSARNQSTQAAAQRRMASQARSSRSRLATSTLSIEEEMFYVKSDIRRLIILSVVCVAILIALAFILPLVL